MSHRVNITLPDEIYEALKEYSDVMQTQPTTVARDLLLEVMPSFIAITQAIKEAENSKKNALSTMQSVLLNHLSTGTTLASELQQEIKNL